MNARKNVKVRRYQEESDLERQYLEIVQVGPEGGQPNNSAALLEQPEIVVGQNFTTYSAGEMPAFLTLK